MCKISVLPRNFIGGSNDPCPQNYCWTVSIKQGTNDEKIKKQMQISWDNVQLNPNKVGHSEILCVNLLSNGTKMQAWQNTGRILMIS